jgi:hypothetical protein
MKNKIIKYSELSEDHIHWDDEEEYGISAGSQYAYYSKEQKEKDKDKAIDTKVSPDEQEILDDLTSLLQQMFVGAGFQNVSVTNEGHAVAVQIYFEIIEKLSHIKGVFEVVSKIRRDTLKDYDSELTIYETEDEDKEPFIEVLFFQRNHKPYPNYSAAANTTTALATTNAIKATSTKKETAPGVPSAHKEAVDDITKNLPQRDEYADFY